MRPKIFGKSRCATYDSGINSITEINRATRAVIQPRRGTFLSRNLSRGGIAAHWTEADEQHDGGEPDVEPGVCHVIRDQT